MAINISTGKPICYEAGTSGASYVVGYESRQNRVVRYGFRTGPGGASEISVNIPNLSKSDGTGSADAPLRFFIGTSPTSHANAGAGSTYLGQLTMTTAGGFYHFSGSAKVVLTPNTDYYLWIFPGSTTFGWWWVPSQGTATVTVHTAAMSDFTVSNGTLGQAQTITITRHGSGFLHTLYYRYGSGNWAEIAKGVETAYSWTPALSLAACAPSDPSFQVTVLCRTYNGSTVVGEVSKAITLTIPDSVKPTVSMTVTDPKGYASKYGGYVQGQSGVKATLTEELAYGSPIVSRKITVGSVSGGSTSMTVQPIPLSGTVRVTATVTDARGRTGSASQDITVQPYALPTASVSGQRCNSEGVPDPAGAYLLAAYSGSVTSLEGKNTGVFTLRHRRAGNSAWSTQEVTASGSTVFPAEKGYLYELQLEARDDFSTQSSQVFPVPSAYVGMSMAKNADGVIDGITFGGTAHPGGGFTCEMKAHFVYEGKVYDLADWVVEQGISETWRWRKWASGLAECWGTLLCTGVETPNPWGALYGSSGQGPFDYPLSFAERPRQQLSISQTSKNAFMLEYPATPGNTETNTGRFWLLRPANTEGENTVCVDVYAAGKWK